MRLTDAQAKELADRVKKPYVDLKPKILAQAIAEIFGRRFLIIRTWKT